MILTHRWMVGIDVTGVDGKNGNGSAKCGVNFDGGASEGGNWAIQLLHSCQSCGQNCDRIGAANDAGADVAMMK